MASDPSIYQNVDRPSVALLNPLDVRAKKNSLALQDQSLQSGAMQLQQEQLAMQDAAARRAALTNYYGGAPAGAPPAGLPPPALGPSVDPLTGTALPAPPPPAAGAPAPQAAPAPPPVPPRPAVPTMAYLIQHHVSPGDAATMIAQFQKVDQGAADIDKARSDAQKSTNEANGLVADQAAQMADAVIKSGMNPQMLQWHLQHFASLGPQYAQMANQVGQQLANSSPADQLALLQSFTRAPKQIEATAAEATAAEKTTTANRQANDDEDKRGLALLGSTKGFPQQAYATVFNRLSPGFLARNPGLDTAANWTPASAAKAQQMGLTPQEQVTTAAQAQRDAQTAENQKQERAISQARLNLEKQRYSQDFGNPLAGVSDADMARLKAVANGDIPAPTSRSVGFQKTMDQVLSIDPTYTAARFTAKQDFKTKGDANSLVQMATALSHLDRAGENSGAVGTAPLQRFNLTPEMHRYSADVDLLTGEVGKLVKNGVVSEGESNRMIDNLRSWSQGNRDSALDELKDLMNGKIQGIAQKYKAATGQDLPRSMFDPATQARMAKYGVGVADSASPAPAAPAPAAALPHGIPELGSELGSTFNGGKVLKVTRIQ